MLDILGAINIQIVGNIETGNNVTEAGSLKDKKVGTQDRTPGYAIGE